MMVGRERELWTLQRLYARVGFQYPVQFVRRRVGKTYLMSHFAQDKPTIFFTAVEDNAVLNLRNLSREIYAYDQPDADPRLAPLYQDFQTAFEAVFTRATKRQVVFIIDEYPYLAKADASIPSILQALIDRHRESSQPYLILCGSSLSFMREQVWERRARFTGVERHRSSSIRSISKMCAGSSPRSIRYPLPSYMAWLVASLSISSNSMTVFPLMRTSSRRSWIPLPSS